MKSKTKKWQIEPNMGTVLEAKSFGSDQKTVLRGELLIWRTKNQARDPGTLQLKDSTQGLGSGPGTLAHLLTLNCK